MPEAIQMASNPKESGSYHAVCKYNLPHCILTSPLKYSVITTLNKKDIRSPVKCINVNVNYSYYLSNGFRVLIKPQTLSICIPFMVMYVSHEFQKTKLLKTSSFVKRNGGNFRNFEIQVMDSTDDVIVPHTIGCLAKPIELLFQ